MFINEIRNYQQKRNDHGFAAITSMIVISVVVLAIATSVALMGIDHAQNSLSTTKSLEANTMAKSCVEEALYRLRDDANYTGGSLVFTDGSCVIVISGTGSNRDISSISTITGPPSYVYSLLVSVKRTGQSINITNWQEG